MPALIVTTSNKYSQIRASIGYNYYMKMDKNFKTLGLGGNPSTPSKKPGKWRVNWLLIAGILAPLIIAGLLISFKL